MGKERTRPKPSTESPAEDVAGGLLRVDTVYHEPAVPEYQRGAEILARFPYARRVEVPSHWNIPELHRNEGLAEDWNATKRSKLVLGVKKGLSLKSYERSADFVAPSQANGCAMSCNFCYVARRKGYANPITTFVNIEEILAAIERHAARQGMKLEPTQAGRDLWVYELGTNSDCAVDAAVGDNVRDLVGLFRELPNAKATFATKFVNRGLLDYDPRGKTRLRFSLMPPGVSRVVDVRTSKVEERIAAMGDFVEAGYEVNVNFAPVILYDGWLRDWAELFGMLDAALPPAGREQLAAEIIFLTHTEELHEVNLRWHPEGERLLWRPDIQEHKVSRAGGGRVLRYERNLKRRLVRDFRDLIAEKLPYCRVRYAF